jgi:hypothetical protein
MKSRLTTIATRLESNGETREGQHPITITISLSNSGVSVFVSVFVSVLVSVLVLLTTIATRLESNGDTREGQHAITTLHLH